MQGRLRIGGIGGPLVALALGLAAGPAGMAAAQNRAERLRAKWEQEPNAVRKAKIMERLGEAEFQDISREAASENTRAALEGFRQYRDEMRRSLKGLDARGADAEKHPSGFKQAQISTRESLLRINDVIAGLTADEQGPFLEVRKDLEEMNRHLIRELFPRQPAESAPPGKAN